MRVFSPIFFIIIFFSVRAQFNVIVEDSTSNQIYINIPYFDDDYVYIKSGKSDSLGNRGNCFTKYDLNGNIIWSKLYSKNNEQWYEGSTFDIIKQNNYVSILQKENTYSIPGIMILNNSFDTLFTKEFSFDTVGAKIFGICSTYNNGILLSGQKKINDITVDGYFIKLNNNYDTLWTKLIGNSSDDMLGEKVIEMYDSSLISIGWTAVGTATFKQDWYIVKTDSLGILDWWQHPGNPSLNDGAAQDIVQTHDSCFVVVGGKAVYNVTDEPKFDGRIMKFDINGNILWDKTYRKRLYNNYDSVYCFFNSIVELNDGGFAVIATEEQDLGGTQYHNVLYRFNSNGDTLWTKQYCSRCTYSNDGVCGTEWGKTIQKTDDGGFLIGGWGEFVYIFDHPYEQQMFLIKTDSLGCDGTEFSCPLVNVPSVVKNEESVLVYPNPAINSLTLSLPKREGINKNTSIFIYDAYGRVVTSYKVNNTTKNTKTKQLPLSKGGEGGLTYIINISQLQKGIYFIRIGDITKKFVKL